MEFDLLIAGPKDSCKTFPPAAILCKRHYRRRMTRARPQSVYLLFRKDGACDFSTAVVGLLAAI